MTIYKKIIFSLTFLIIFAITFTNGKLFEAVHEDQTGRYFKTEIIDEGDIFLRRNCKCVEKSECIYRDQVILSR